MPASEPIKLTKIQIAQVGHFKGHPAGPFTLDANVFNEIIRNFEREGKRPIPIDFEHASEADPTSGTIPVNGAPAQGWIHSLENRGSSGLWADVEWLPQAREQIRNKQYMFFSPAIRFDSRDKITGQNIGARLTSGAMTNTPYLPSMAPLSAKDRKTGQPLTFTACMSDTGNTALIASAPERTVLMQGMLADGTGYQDHTQLMFAVPSNVYMPKIKAAMGLHPLASYDEIKDGLDRLRDLCGGDANMADGVSLAAYTDSLRDLTYGPGAAIQPTPQQIFDAVEAMIDAAQAKHVAIGHPAGAQMDDVDMPMAGYTDHQMASIVESDKAKQMASIVESDKAKQMATAIESDKGGAIPAAGYTDKNTTATMADNAGDTEMAIVAEKDAEITRLTLQLSDKEAEITKLKTENMALTAFKAEREEQDLERDVAFVMSAHADKIAHLPGDEAAKKTFLLKARKQLGEDFWVQYPKDVDPTVAAHSYLLTTHTPTALPPTQSIPEVEAILASQEDVRATTQRLRDEKKLSYEAAAQQAMRLHKMARQLAG